MIEFLKEKLSKIVEGYADIRFENRTHTTIRMTNGNLEEINSSKISGGSVRFFYKGAFGFATFTKIEEVDDALRTAEKLAKMLKTETIINLKPVKIYKDYVKPNIYIHPNSVSLDEKVDLVRKYHNLFEQNEKIITRTVTYSENILTRYLVTSEGTEITEERPYCGIAVQLVGKEGSVIQRAAKSFGDLRGYKTVLDREGDFEKLKKDLFDLLKADKVEGGVYTVILDPEIAGVFIHEAFGHLSEADHIYRNEKLQEIMRPGKQIATDILSVVDDGSLEGERGYIAYDDDGIKSRKTYLIKNGRLVGRLHSRYTASLMDEEPTGNSRAISFSHVPIVRMTNTYIENGESEFEDLLEGVDKGLYVVGALGGNTELELFTFSAKMAYKIEGGKIKEPVRDVVLSGNLFETLKNIDKIGNDLQLFGGLGGCGKGGQAPLPVSDGAPHIRIKNVVIGGR
ncbi:MAG: TldD/PmbA family protein [candidate division WOR-3 bacterium]